MKINSIFKLSILCLLFVSLLAIPFSVFAQDETPDVPVIENPLPEDSPLFPLYENIIGLIGIGGTLVLTLTALFKRVPVLKDLSSQHVSTALTLLVFVAYTGFYYLGLSDQYPDVITGLNTIGTGLLAILGTSIAAEYGYRGAKAASVPILGYSKEEYKSASSIEHQNSSQYDG